MTNENIQVNQNDLNLVVWEDKFATGIEMVDTQHKQLFDLTNHLYNACFEKDDVLQTMFKESMSKMVEYVRFHFNSELKLLKAVNFPDYHNHKGYHDSLIKEILAAVKDHNDGKKFVPNHFVRTLKDWILSHIAVYDKAYGIYIKDLLNNGKLTLKALKEIESSIS